MGDKDKVQGEGDYEAARRYNEGTREFIDKAKKTGKKLTGNAAAATEELTSAEREALTHAKDGGEDKRDADSMRRSEEKSADRKR